MLTRVISFLSVNEQKDCGVIHIFEAISKHGFSRLLVIPWPLNIICVHDSIAQYIVKELSIIEGWGLKPCRHKKKLCTAKKKKILWS